MNKDVIYRQDAIMHFVKASENYECGMFSLAEVTHELWGIASAQTERLTDDDFETIRIHLNSYKEKLCNQQRWKEAEEYQRIIDRFMAFASTQPERKKGKWITKENRGFIFRSIYLVCPFCGNTLDPDGLNAGRGDANFCPNCGAEMR